MHLIWSLLIVLLPVGVMVAAIGGTLWWCCWFGARGVARKRRAELLATFLRDVLEPELYRELKELKSWPEGSSYTLGMHTERASILYRMFEELGGVKALSPYGVRLWERLLERLVYKFGLTTEDVRGGSRCRHPVRFTRLRPLEELEESK